MILSIAKTDYTIGTQLKGFQHQILIIQFNINHLFALCEMFNRIVNDKTVLFDPQMGP